jgi:hypothetical protein
VARNSSDDARRSEEGKFHWRSGLVSYTVAFTPVINGELKQVTGELIQFHYGECDTMARIVYWLELSTTMIFV